MKSEKDPLVTRYLKMGEGLQQAEENKDLPFLTRKTGRGVSWRIYLGIPWS